jgi:nitrate/nitrite transporter NarK
VATEEGGKASRTLGEVFRSALLWRMSAIYFSLVMGLYGISFWLPTIISATGVRHPLDVGLLTAIPYVAGALCMIPLSRRSDRLLERRWHIAIPALLGGLGLLLSTTVTDNTALSMVAMTIAAAGILSTLPLFWSLPTAVLSGAAAAAGLAMINSIGNLAGFASPYLVGAIAGTTHDTRLGMALLAASMFVGAALTLSLPKAAH